MSVRAHDHHLSSLAIDGGQFVTGAILIAPLAARFATRSVLSVAVIVFALMTTILLITDAATGGHIRKPGGKVLYGDWNPNAIFVSCSVFSSSESVGLHIRSRSGRSRVSRTVWSS